MTNTETTAALAKFVSEVQALVANHFATKFPTITPDTIDVEMGRRYAKIIKRMGSGRSVYCFVDLSNGDILKAASFKAPAKGARGNIHTYGNVTECVSAYGALSAR